LDRSGDATLVFAALPFGAMVRIVVAGCNTNRQGPVNVIVGRLRLVRRSGAIATLIDSLRGWRREKFHPRWISFFYSAKLPLLTMTGRLLARLGATGHWAVVDCIPAGYAIRGIDAFKDDTGKMRLITADAGDDAVAVVDVEDGRLARRRAIKLSPSSTPIHLVTLAGRGGRPGAAVCMFNFDAGDTVRAETLLCMIDDLPAFAGRDGTVDPGRDLRGLLRRPGHWGFRGVCKFQGVDGADSLAAVDRSTDLLHLIDDPIGKKEPAKPARVLHLGDGVEPIAVAACPIEGNPGAVAFYVNSRRKEELIVARCAGADALPEIVQRVPIGGRSRSSVAVGRFRANGGPQVAAALWGGDPTVLNAAGVGGFVVGDIVPDGTVRSVTRHEAGINPTDIVAGDLDGDGVDELAVLNYGSGLNVASRMDAGGLHIYKYRDGSFVRVANIDVPSPRIGAIADIDGDGRNELIVSLFHERRLAVVKLL
jgi:hypothetical protein